MAYDARPASAIIANWLLRADALLALSIWTGPDQNGPLMMVSAVAMSR
jgi:hypothetical protein